GPRGWRDFDARRGLWCTRRGRCIHLEHHVGDGLAEGFELLEGHHAAYGIAQALQLLIKARRLALGGQAQATDELVEHLELGTALTPFLFYGPDAVVVLSAPVVLIGKPG